MALEIGDVLVGGMDGAADALVLSRPISFWGGIDPASGTVIDPRHPDHRASIAGKVLFLPGTIGSSSASAVLMELVHAGKAPAAIVLHEPDAILLVGLICAREMAWNTPPAFKLNRERHGQFAGHRVSFDSGGRITSP
ncbi:DUF126 domain-containing protein [Mesorhizobium sp. Z1-4]|uniref:aconitase X swivel domain-containing protein n=1 Tax=Mesorhizobium sp. Z1-4 TaxID=2448478 RepID=UPI000FD99A21|nr:DUF126 domain-containing protein [Mesorhizobium sp. Z1-4]